MKKMIVLILAVLACSMLFAMKQSVNVGAGYQIGFGNAAKKDSTMPDRKLKDSFMDAFVGYNIEFDNKLVAYNNASFGFLGKMQFMGEGTFLQDNIWGSDGEWYEIDNGDTSNILLSNDSGAGYAFYFGDVRLIAGGGIHYELMISKGINESDLKKANYHNLGINLLAQADYKLNDKFGIMAAVRPNVNLLSIWNRSWSLETLNNDCSGFAPGFSGSVVVGASYSL